MEQKMSKKMRNQKKGRKTLRQNQNDSSYRLINRGLSYAPDSVVVTLTYSDAAIDRNNAGNKFMYWRIRMNSVYDPDPLVLSGAVSGFTEWAAIYRRYLVLKCEIDSTIVNKEAFPVGVSFAPSDFDLTPVIIGPSTAQDLSELPYAIPTKVLSTLGGQDKLNFRKSIDLAKFTGQRGAYHDSLQYSSLVNTNPSTLLFWNAGLFTDTNMVSGIFQNTKYHYTVLFTERQSLFA